MQLVVSLRQVESLLYLPLPVIEHHVPRGQVLWRYWVNPSRQLSYWSRHVYLQRSLLSTWIQWLRGATGLAFKCHQDSFGPCWDLMVGGRERRLVSICYPYLFFQLGRRCSRTLAMWLMCGLCTTKLELVRVLQALQQGKTTALQWAVIIIVVWCLSWYWTIQLSGTWMDWRRVESAFHIINLFPIWSRSDSAWSKRFSVWLTVVIGTTVLS